MTQKTKGLRKDTQEQFNASFAKELLQRSIKRPFKGLNFSLLELARSMALCHHSALAPEALTMGPHLAYSTRLISLICSAELASTI